MPVFVNGHRFFFRNGVDKGYYLCYNIIIEIRKGKRDLMYIDKIIEEIMGGKYERDILPESALEFSGEAEATYFANLRNSMNSDMARRIMTVPMPERET